MAWLARPALLVSGIGDGVGLHPGEQVVVLLEQTGDDLVGGIVGVGDEVEGLFDGGDAREGVRALFVEQGCVDRDWTTPVPHQRMRTA